MLESNETRSEEEAAYLDTIQSCSTSLLTLVNDLLDLSRIQVRYCSPNLLLVILLLVLLLLLFLLLHLFLLLLLLCLLLFLLLALRLSLLTRYY